MKFMHLGDLHLGKRLNGFSLIEDQRHALRELADLAREREVDAVVIAGDVYDKPTPSVQAVELADVFITELVESGMRVFIIGGNHDSTARLAFASGITRERGLFIARPYAGRLEWVDVDEFSGAKPIRIHLLPFVTPLDVRRYFEDREIATYDDAVAAVLEDADMGPGANVLVAHQLVLGQGEAQRSDSEQISIGGIDEVSASHLDGFDYVALGHLHAPQWVARREEGPVVRYCGSPLKYSFSEVSQRKSATIVEVDGADVRVDEVPLQPLHDMRELAGTIDEMRAALEEDPSLADCYVRAVLSEPVINAKAKLQDLFPLVMRIEFDYAPSGREAPLAPVVDNPGQADPSEVFASLFSSINGRAMSEAESEVLSSLVRRVVERPGVDKEGGVG